MIAFLKLYLYTLVIAILVNITVEFFFEGNINAYLTFKYFIIMPILSLIISLIAFKLGARVGSFKKSLLYKIWKHWI